MNKYAQALAAIRELFGSTSDTVEDTKANLQALKEEIEAMLASLPV